MGNDPMEFTCSSAVAMRQNTTYMGCYSGACNELADPNMPWVQLAHTAQYCYNGCRKNTVKYLSLPESSSI